MAGPGWTSRGEKLKLTHYLGLCTVIYCNARLESEQNKMKDRDSIENWGQ